MFVLTKEGRAGIRDVVGVYSNMEEADKAATEAIKQEVDDYHYFSLRWFPVNKMNLYWEKDISKRGTNPLNEVEIICNYTTTRIHDAITVDKIVTSRGVLRKAKPRNATEEIAYLLLSGDPVTTDAVHDVLQRGG